SSRQVPVRVRRLVLEDPGSEEAPVGRRPKPDLLEEGAKREVEAPQVVERNAREVVVLEVVSRREVPEVPEAAGPDDRTPLGGIGRIDRVVLAEPVQSERDREDQEDRCQVDAAEHAEPAEGADRRHETEMEQSRSPPLPGD